MADPTVFSMLKRGVNEWNEWRKDNPKIQPNLKGARLGGAKLFDANLADADLSLANLSGADLRLADLKNARLSEANLTRAILTSTDLRNVYLMIEERRHDISRAISKDYLQRLLE